jgi:hypothetical protein
MRVAAALSVSGNTYAEIISKTTAAIAEFFEIDEDEIESKVDIEIDIKDQGVDALEPHRYAATAHLRLKR